MDICPLTRAWHRRRNRVTSLPVYHEGRGDVPVSYTHLDVYKRQLLHGPRPSKSQRLEAGEVLWTKCGCSFWS